MKTDRKSSNFLPILKIEPVTALPLVEAVGALP